jgi:large subunit ribosomal protein L4
MASVDVLEVGKKSAAGSVDLDPTIFEAPVRPHLFHAEVRRQLARRHAGTHATKNRSAVSGGGEKPWRQKGTGRARQGSIRSPQWSGGGVVFGPVPRSYEHRLTKKTRRAALKSALSLRTQEGALAVVEGLAIDEFKTRRVVEMLEGLGLAGESALIVIAAASPHLEISARNLPGISVIRAEGLNVYDVLRHKRLVIAKDALEKIGARLGTAEKGEES